MTLNNSGGVVVAGVRILAALRGRFAVDGSNDANNSANNVLDDVPLWIWDAFYGFAIGLGLLLLLFGSRYKKFSCALCALGVGGFGSFAFAHGIGASVNACLALGAVGGVALAGFALCVKQVSKIATGLALAIALGVSISETGIAQGWAWTVIGALSLLCVALSFFFWNTAVILATSITGSFAIMQGVAFFSDVPVPWEELLFRPENKTCATQHCRLLLAGWAGAALLGACFQRFCLPEKTKGYTRQRSSRASSSEDADDIELLRKNISARRKRKSKKKKKYDEGEASLPMDDGMTQEDLSVI